MKLEITAEKSARNLEVEFHFEQIQGVNLIAMVIFLLENKFIYVNWAER